MAVVIMPAFCLDNNSGCCTSKQLWGNIIVQAISLNTDLAK